MRPSELQLNRIAQGLVTTAAGVSWFESLSATEQASVLKDLSFICVQAHPRREEFSEAIARSGLKQSFTPCVVLQTATTPSVAISKIASLTESEYVKSFRLLISLFSVADTRRRETLCKDGCTHEWHNLAAL